MLDTLYPREVTPDNQRMSVNDGQLRTVHAQHRVDERSALILLLLYLPGVESAGRGKDRDVA